MLIAFEGIDGSGKTTLSNLLAKALKKAGVPVFHARENGILGSGISTQIRGLTQSPANLALTPEAEMLLYAAREAQLLGEVVTPRLKTGHVVLCDRSLYTPLVLSSFGRGLPRASVEAALSAASGGRWPDLVFYCAVPWEISRARKKQQKLIDGKTGPGSRKGTAGLGLRRRLAEGYEALSQEKQFVRLDAERLNPEQMLAAALAVLAPRLGLSAPVVPAPPPPLFVADSAAPLRARYFSAVEHAAGRDPRFAAYLLNGFEAQEAYALREGLAPLQPALVAYGLGGLRSEEAQSWREKLAVAAPVQVARSLRGVYGDAPLALRASLVRTAPDAVAYSLQGARAALMPEFWPLRFALAEQEPAIALLAARGLDDENAWALRARYAVVAPDACLKSLGYLGSPRAWTMRRTLLDKGTPLARLDSIAGLDDDDAWALREALLSLDTLAVLHSVRGLSSARAYDLRERLLPMAPKPVLQGLNPLLDDPRAWALRRAAAEDVPEALESMRGLDHEEAWAFRARLRERWRFAVISSLGALSFAERGKEFIHEQLERAPDDLFVAKHALRSLLAPPPVGEGRT